MIDIGTERGGESDGILRIELSLPVSVDELKSLRDWLDSQGFSPDVDQIDDYLG